MDVAVKLADAQVKRVAIVDDDLSERITTEDLESADPQVVALLNDPTDPDRESYLALLIDEGQNPAALEDLAEPLSDAAIRAAAPHRIRAAAEAALAVRRERAEPVRLVIKLLEQLGIQAAAIDTYYTPHVPDDLIYDLIIVDYFLVDTATDATVPFIRNLLSSYAENERPLQVILMSSHDQQLKADFTTIRPALMASSSRLRIMEKPKLNTLVLWKAALYQLASDRPSVPALEKFIRDAGAALEHASKITANKLWEIDLQAMDLLHDLASKDSVDYVRYVEEAVSRLLLSGIEVDGGMRASLRDLNLTFAKHRNTNLLSPVAEIGDSHAAIHGLMHSMEWRAGEPGLPEFPTAADELERSRWIRRHIRFGMVLRDQQGKEWLNITQACDLAQTRDEDIEHSTITFLRGKHSLPAEKPDGDYYHAMIAMMAKSENHVLTWNLRNVRTESIQSFSATYGMGWQVIGELRPEVALTIAAKFGARAARVGLPVTLSAWRVSGFAVRVGDIRCADDSTPLDGMPLNGYAIMRARAKTHELHLDRTSLDGLLTAHGATFDDSVLSLLAGVQMKKGGCTSLSGRPVILYCDVRASNIKSLREQLKNDQWVDSAANAERILVVLWCAP